MGSPLLDNPPDPNRVHDDVHACAAQLLAVLAASYRRDLPGKVVAHLSLEWLKSSKPNCATFCSSICIASGRHHRARIRGHALPAYQAFAQQRSRIRPPGGCCTDHFHNLQIASSTRHCSLRCSIENSTSVSSEEQILRLERRVCLANPTDSHTGAPIPFFTLR